MTQDQQDETSPSAIQDSQPSSLSETKGLDSTPGQQQQQEQPLSKNAQKRLKRKQEWEAQSEHRKALKKQKKEFKKLQKREALERGERSVVGQGDKARKKMPTEIRMAGIGLLIDLDFVDKMNEKVLY
jgi:hypothetical protein